MAEGVNPVVVIVITAAGIPSHDMGVRAELHKRIRAGRSRERMSVKTGSDEWIDIRKAVVYLLLLSRLCAACEASNDAAARRMSVCFI